MTKRPSLQFYPADWRNDPALRMCSPAARGLWIDMICIMHEAEPYGHLIVGGVPVTPEELAMIVGGHSRDVAKWLDELGRRKVYSVTSDGVIFSRRMVRDENDRKNWRDRQGKSRGSHADVTQNVTLDVTAMSRRSSSSPSSSPSVQEEEEPKVSSPPAEAVATKGDPPDIPKPKVQRRTQISDDCPSLTLQGQAVQFWGVKARLDLVDRLADQVAQFRDHHLKNGSLMADWDAAWRTWYRKALEFTRSNGHGRKESTHEQGHRIALELIAELAESDTATDHRPHYGARAALPQISDDRRRTEVVAQDLLRRSGQ